MQTSHNDITTTENSSEELILTNVKYICKSTSLITDSLQKGHDVAQLPNGDIIVTEVKTINTQYSWDATRQRMIKISQN